jgi:acetylornithine/succinyldiaminopimelate/putrescine aminotransferase
MSSKTTFEIEDRSMAPLLVESSCLSKGLFVRQTQDTGIRIFPALNINKEEMEEGLSILKESIKAVIDESPTPNPTIPPVKK